MDTQILNYITSIAFFVIIGFFAVISLLTIYIFIRYGRSKGITVLTSLIYIVLFVTAASTAFITIQKIF